MISGVKILNTFFNVLASLVKAFISDEGFHQESQNIITCEIFNYNTTTFRLSLCVIFIPFGVLRIY